MFYKHAQRLDIIPFSKNLTSFILGTKYGYSQTIHMPVFQLSDYLLKGFLIVAIFYQHVINLVSQKNVKFILFLYERYGCQVDHTACVKF